MDDKEKIKKVATIFNDLIIKGKSLQEKGHQIVKYSEQGLANVTFIQTHYTDFDTTLPEYSLITNTFDFFINSYPSISADLYTASAITEKSSNLVATGSLLGTSAMNIYASMAPTLDLSSPPFSHIVIQEELDNYLKMIDPKLVERRKGAWDAFYSISQDNYAQASHTMRDIFAKIISKYASNELVTKAAWWTPAPNTKAGVSQEQRLSYLLNGPNALSTEPSLLRLVQIGFKSDKLLKSIAHGKNPLKESIEAAMHSIESFMLAIFKSGNFQF